MKRMLIVGCLIVMLIAVIMADGSAQKKGQKNLLSREQIREMVKDLDGLPAAERKGKIREYYEKYGKPMRRKLTKAKYRPGVVDENTKAFEFKEVPGRRLKIYIKFPEDWKNTDCRPAIVFWHGGGFTQGGANQFEEQAKYFTKRGAVVAQPEYRIRDVDGTMPHHAIEDAISAMRWFKARAKEFGVDAERIAAGGGSAGGCIGAVLGTLDFKKYAEMGWIGAEDDKSIDPRPYAMILYNPFVDFFEPLNDRHVEEECLMNGVDPKDMEPVYHAISAIEQLKTDSPPSIILFGTRDAFYPQQIRWIPKCRELGLVCHDYVYKGEVHSWFNNSPHLEYTTDNVNKFLVEIGFLEKEPVVELPQREISDNRSEIQETKYDRKTDWDEQERFQRYVKEQNITIIPFKHYEIDK